jgi:hypothetical protein
MEAPESRRNAATGDEPPRKGANFAYEHPLPDSMRRAIVDVTVVDAESRAPVVGAEVQILNYVDLKFHPLATDEHGRVRVVYPFADDPQLSIEVRKEGYIPQRAGWFDRKKEEPPRELTIALRHGVTIGGLVTDEAGHPIEGVTVVATVDEHASGDRLTDPLGYEIFYEVPFRTGPDGRWSTSSCPPLARKLSLQLNHPDYVSGGGRTLGGSGRRVPDFEGLRRQTDRQIMAKGVRVDGWVVDAESKPVPGARVVDSSRGLTFLSWLREATTDQKGHFHIHCMPGESMTMLVQVRGYQPVTRSFKARAGVQPVEFRLDPGKVMKGRVVDTAGKPIAGASVLMLNSARNRGIFLRTWTDMEGRFVWDSAPDHSVELTIGKPGYLDIEQAPFTARDQEIEIVLKPALTVTIRVVDAASGQPIVSFDVERRVRDVATGGMAWNPVTARRPDNGARELVFDATDVPDQLQVRSLGYTPAVFRVVQGEERETEVVVRLEKAADQ